MNWANRVTDIGYSLTRGPAHLELRRPGATRCFRLRRRELMLGAVKTSWGWGHVMRRLAALGTALAVVLSWWVVLPAAALAPSLRFTADALPTWQTNGTVWGMAAAQGKVFAGGTFTALRPPRTVEGAAG